jgi:hypothetical protein
MCGCTGAGRSRWQAPSPAADNDIADVGPVEGGEQRCEEFHPEYRVCRHPHDGLDGGTPIAADRRPTQQNARLTDLPVVHDRLVVFDRERRSHGSR